MPGDEVRELIASVAKRGAAIAVSVPPDEIRHRFAAGPRCTGHRVAGSSTSRTRLSLLLVAAVVVAAFLVPLPHVSLFKRLVITAKPATSTSVPATVPSTAPKHHSTGRGSAICALQESREARHGRCQ